jgi:hypothetical protein
MAKQEQHSIIEPSEEELVVYKQLVTDLPDDQMDDLANEYFEKVNNEDIGISFPRYLIDKFVRPVQPGDTIHFQTEDRKNKVLFCLVREIVEEVTYLIFAEADPETENLNTEFIYLFHVCGLDNIGTEMIDILPNSPEADKILDILEAKTDVKVAEVESTSNNQSEQS